MKVFNFYAITKLWLNTDINFVLKEAKGVIRTMIELPETYVLSDQIKHTLVGKVIINAAADTYPHAFAMYTGEPATYNERLAGKKITDSNPGTVHTCGGHIEILCEDILLVITTPVRYHAPGEKLPKSHQLLLTFQDDSHMSCTVQMWGALFCYPADIDGLPYEKGYVCNRTPTPFEDDFDEIYFDKLWHSVKSTMSVKAFLTTQQRIPGFGNGVLQDVLWNAGIHPKRKLETISTKERFKLYQSIKSTLLLMKEQGGRDTEKDLFGYKGGYQTILSSRAINKPCPVCDGKLIRKSYLGGNIYYCESCQPMAE